MKAIAIVELPDDAFDKGKWYLDNIYYTERKSLFDDYANDMWELKPLPKWRDVPEYLETNRDWEAWGYDQCLTEILGDAEGEAE